jgi:spore coat polysaccharide biosynthesis protein SpsF (cytidylyltransferase family)
MKSACIVQARLGSTRLPRKVLLPLNGHTVIGEVLTRCASIRTDALICAIPYEDDELAHEAGKYARVIRGPTDDVLLRYVVAGHGFDVVMRVTADCPLLSWQLCNSVLSALGDNDYASNIEPRTFPKGMDCEVFTYKALLEADRNTVSGREHVTPYLRTGPFRRVNVASPWKLDGRLTLDTEDDYRTIRAAFESC